MKGAFENDIIEVNSLLDNMLIGIGPRVDTIPKFSGFVQLCIARMASFFAKDVRVQVASSEPGVLKFVTKAHENTMYGREAVEYAFRAMEDCMNEKRLMTMNDIAPLKTYGWLLTAEQRGVVSNWARAIGAGIIKKGTGLGMQLLDKMGAEAESTAIVPTATFGGSSSSRDMSALSVGPVLSAKGKKASVAKKETEDAMLCFFKPKSGK